MTRKDKFLKEDVNVKEFIQEIEEELDLCGREFNIERWLNEPIKPTLTEDEKVILRNIPKEFPTIARNSIGELSARNEKHWIYADVFNHLFQFIKEGEEYSIEELLKGR